MTFETFRTIFFFAVAAFILVAFIKMLMMKWRWDHEKEMREQRLLESQRAGEAGAGSTTSPDAALHSTFGFSGQSASDSTPAGSFGPTVLGETGIDDSSDCDPGDTGADCGDTGGGDSGGGGWSD